MHYAKRLPDRVAAGIARGKDLRVEIVTSVGGRETRNKLWGAPLRTYEVPFPNMKLDDPDSEAINDLWDLVDGSTHTFEHYDEIADEVVRVRFDGLLRQVHEEGPYWRFETLLLVEVRDEDN